MSNTHSLLQSAANYVTILGCGPESPPSICITTAKDRILINCPEGTQRLMTENKLKLTNKASSFFFTQNNWEYITGITDCLLKMSEEGQTQLNLTGVRMKEYMMSTSYFLGNRPNMSLNLVTLPEVGDVHPRFSSFQTEDGTKISPYVLNPDAEKEVEKDRNHLKRSFEEMEQGEKAADNEIIDMLLPDHKHGSIHTLLLSYSPYHRRHHSKFNSRRSRWLDDGTSSKTSRLSVCYVVQFPDLPGKFDVKKAEELKVPKGPMRGKLVKGETIVLEDGRKISPSDCVGPGAPGGLVCVIDCPSSLHVKSLQDSKLLSVFSEENVLNRMIYFVHMSPDEVLESEEYAQFTSKIPSCLNITHVVVNSDVQTQRPIYVASERYLKLLSWVDEKFFAPSACQYPSLLSFGPEKSGNIPRREYDRMKNIRATCGWPMQVFILPPHKQTGLKDSIPETSMMHYYCLKGCICNEEERGKLYKPFEERKAQMMENEKTSETSPNIKILFLGTGASAPFKYRTVSSILVELEDGSGVLLDAGDGTYSAMVRKMGQQKAEDILKKLKMICVSHKHADHISGVARILLKRQGLMQVKAEESRLSSDCTWECSVCGKRFTSRSSIELHQKAVHPRNIREPKKVEQDNERYSSPQDLLVIGPMWLEAWLQDLSRLENIPFTFVDCADLQYDNPSRSRKQLDVDMVEVRTALVQHSFPAYGFSFIFRGREDFKLVYSGDTRPCEALIELGKGADLLIHEATHADDMLDKAKSDRHCTVEEAVGVARSMEAKHTILTHFSSRFEKLLPDLRTYREASNIACAVDGMQVSSERLHLLPLVNDIVSDILLAEYGDEEEASEQGEL